jgi:hypothetical protein
MQRKFEEMTKPLLTKNVLISKEGNAPVVALPHNTNPQAICLRQGRNLVTLDVAELDRLFDTVAHSEDAQ